MGLGFGIRDPEKKPIPDPGTRGQKGTGSPIRIRNTGWQQSLSNNLNLSLSGPYSGETAAGEGAEVQGSLPGDWSG